MKPPKKAKAVQEQVGDPVEHAVHTLKIATRTEDDPPDENDLVVAELEKQAQARRRNG